MQLKCEEKRHKKSVLEKPDAFLKISLQEQIIFLLL